MRENQVSYPILKLFPQTVLPSCLFENLGSKEEDEYFSDGITEDIITELYENKESPCHIPDIGDEIQGDK